MNDESLIEDAAQLECLLPTLLRRLFTLDAVAEMPLAQLRVCTILQSGPRSMSALSEELSISVSAVTQIADRLEKAGLVERVSEPDDRRMKNLKLTASGHAIMKNRREMRVQRLSRALEHLSAEDRTQVMRSMESLLQASTAAAHPLIVGTSAGHNGDSLG